jgi:hypothetical protein
MPERFTETMRAASEAGWSHAVQHRFVNELFAGAVPDAVMARYLIQVRLRFGRFISFCHPKKEKKAVPADPVDRPHRNRAPGRGIFAAARVRLIAAPGRGSRAHPS